MDALKTGRHLQWRFVSLGLLSVALVGGVAGISSLVRHRYVEWTSTAGGVDIDAHCSVVAGQSLSSHAINISCGLDKAGVRAVVTQALTGVDLPKLVANSRSGQHQDQVVIDLLARELGVDAAKIEAALQQAGEESIDQTRLPDRVAEILSRDSHMDVEMASVQVVPDDPRQRQPAKRPPAPGPSNDISQRFSHEATTLRASCAAVASQVNVDVIDLHCGPSQAEIQKLVSGVINQADLANLVRLATQGGDPSAPQIAAIANQLGLTNNSVMQMLALLGTAKVPESQLLAQYSELARKHMNSVLRASQLPLDNTAVASLKEQALAALGRGDYGQSEALLAAAELVRRSTETQKPSALTVAAQSEDRGRALLEKQDYVGAAKLFDSAARAVPDDLPLVRAAYLIDQANSVKAQNGDSTASDSPRDAASLYHRAFEAIVLSFADICPGQPAPGKKESYSATSKDRTIWSLDCP
jgi:hypothetical protein